MKDCILEYFYRVFIEGVWGYFTSLLKNGYYV